MKRVILLLIAVLSVTLCSNTKTEQIRPTKNVIVLLSDGTSTSLLSASRWYKYYCGEEHKLNIDSHVCGLIKTYLFDAPIAGSAGAMSALMTGVLHDNPSISTYPQVNHKDDLLLSKIDSSRAFQPLMTVAEAMKVQQNKAIGLVSTVDFYHATPSACFTHSANRNEHFALMCQLASQSLDVMIAGGAKMITKEVKEILKEQEITYIEKDFNAFRNHKEGKLWALLANRNTSYELDRQKEEPSLAEMTDKAIKLLSKNKKGFFLMVEGSKVDMAAHANDAKATITEFLAFDEAVKVAIDFARNNKNTTVLILADHGTSGITLGDREYKNYSDKGLDSMFVNLHKFKCTSIALAPKIKRCKSLEEISYVFKEYTNIQLTQEESQTLFDIKDLQEGNYMSVSSSNNLLSSINRILNNYHHIGFTSGNHTGEDVFLAVYHPKGHKPSGIISNIEFNNYLCSVAGIKSSLEELTDFYYARHSELLHGINFSIISNIKTPTLSFTHNNKRVLIRAWDSKVIIDDKKVQLSTPVVYMKENNIFYISKELLEKL